MRMELYADIYTRKDFHHANTLDGIAPLRERFNATQHVVIHRLRSLGIIEPEG